ncbi:hypothetical protein MMC22_000998 [Lobaria immixta]|nr:hypothetical protein [Lobaria immixta]
MAPKKGEMAKKTVNQPLKTGEFTNHAQLWKNESTSAAYLGYTDVADYRIFRFHWIVFTWFLVHATNCQGTRSDNGLCLIKDVGDNRELFPEDIDELLGKYLTSDNSNKDIGHDNID